MCANCGEMCALSRDMCALSSEMCPAVCEMCALSSEVCAAVGEMCAAVCEMCVAVGLVAAARSGAWLCTGMGRGTCAVSPNAPVQLLYSGTSAHWNIASGGSAAVRVNQFYHWEGQCTRRDCMGTGRAPARLSSLLCKGSSICMFQEGMQLRDTSWVGLELQCRRLPDRAGRPDPALTVLGCSSTFANLLPSIHQRSAQVRCVLRSVLARDAGPRREHHHRQEKHWSRAQLSVVLQTSVQDSCQERVYVVFGTAVRPRVQCFRRMVPSDASCIA